MSSLQYSSRSLKTSGSPQAYVWGRYFNQSQLADTVLAAVLAYNPSTPSWAYNGAALSWGDVGNNGYDPWNNQTHATCVWPTGRRS